MTTREQVIHALTERLRQIERPRSRSRRGDDTPGLEWPGLEGWLATHGLTRGCLVEWLADGSGSGLETLVWLTVRDMARRGDVVVLLDSRQQFFARGMLSLGVPLPRVVLLQPDRIDDTLWSLEQALRSRGVGAVVCAVERLSAKQFRRLQLAAESGGTWGLLLRPASVRRQPSWAEVRLLVEPQATSTTNGRRWRIELLRAKGRCAGDVTWVELDDETDGLRVVPELVAATTAVRAAGA